MQASKDARPLPEPSGEGAPTWPTRFYHSYALRTLLQSLVTIWAVITFTFFLVRLMPGNPVDVYIDFLINQENLSYQEARNRAASQFAFDPDAGLLEQYREYISQLLRGNLGLSITSTGTRVLDQILRFLPWTLFSVGLGLFISFTLGMVVGMVAAYYRNSPIDTAISFFASILSAVPNYIWGLLILIIFGVQLQWFNIGDLRGTYDPRLRPGFTLPFILSVLNHAFLPVLVYVVGALGSWILSMRSSTISVLGEDYVTIAKARGLPQHRIMTAYVGRNASLPLFTLLAISIGFVIGGSIIIEELFVYKGLGSFLFWSISQRDYTSMQGVFLVITVSVVISNVLADLLYSRLDPRVRITGEK
ncbi:MAG: ABC transporter permease [Deinococcota bacterium]|jgi:peptide/nickel transport system permease protein|nr:ABC transporter permease [Deinococcota bacterium]